MYYEDMAGSMKIKCKVRSLEFETRPWGSYIVLVDSKKYKVKKLVLNPKKRFSLQYHKKRTETWTMVCGKVLITIDSKRKVYQYGQTVSVKAGAVHRVENIGRKPAEIIEVQTGTYFGEDDISRLEDDYGRIQ